AAGSKRDANALIGRAVAAQSDALTAGADRGEGYRAGQRKLQEALDTFTRAGTDVGAYQRAGAVGGQAGERLSAAAEEAKKNKAAARQPAPLPKPKEVVVPFEE